MLSLPAIILVLVEGTIHDWFLFKALQSPNILLSQGVTRPRLSVVFGPCKALKDTSHHAGL